MKTILAILLLLCLSVRAAMYPLEWDASPTPGVKYAAWVRKAGAADWNLHGSTALTNYRLTGLTPGGWEMQVTAYFPDSGIHSEPSNILTLTVPAEAPEPPANPRARQLAVLRSTDLNEWELFAIVQDAENLPIAQYTLAFVP